MKRRVVLMVLALFAAVSGLSAQDNRVLQAYRDRFGDATPEVKLQILQTADMLSVEELGPLYAQAVRFVLTNADQIGSDVIIRDIALYAVEKIGEAGYTPAVASLWSLFREYVDDTSRLLILNVISGIGRGNAQIVRDLNGWVEAQTNLHRSGVRPDQQVLFAAIRTLGELSDTSSFPVLLNVRLAGISNPISVAANDSMRSLAGDYPQLAIDATNARPVIDRLPALEYFLDDPELSADERGRIATAVLSATTREVVRLPTDVEAQRRVRYRSAGELMNVSYPAATEPLIRHFDLTFSDFGNGRTIKTWVLEAIAALGATGTERAAERLTALLELLNNYTENDRPYDTQITLAVVTNLEDLGYDVAYDALFHATLLDYPQLVKNAARIAIDAITR